MRPDPVRGRWDDGGAAARAGRWPWGTTAAVGAAAAATWTAAGPTWWSGLPVPRVADPGDLLGPGAAVPVSGPGARDGDGDGAPDTLVVARPGGWTVWVDLDADGLADRVTGTGVPPLPDPLVPDPLVPAPPVPDPDGRADLLGAVLHRLGGA